MKNYIIGAVIIGLFIFGGLAMFGGKTTVEVIDYGASPGPDHYNMEYFHAGLVQGGDVTTIATATTTILTAYQVCNSSVINFAANASEGIASTTLPTSGSLISLCLPSVGSTKTILFRNTSDAASTTVIEVASTTLATLLLPASTTGNVTIDGQNSVFITFIRTTASATVMIISELIDAD